jgi:thiamine-phosphate pyrophosphorylase
MSATRLPRLHVITDTRGPAVAPSAVRDANGLAAKLIDEPPASWRDPLLVTAAALAAGARLVQVRPEDHYNDRAAFDLATAIAALCDAHGALCLVNDRVHIAQAIGADGVHLGAEDLPIDAARRARPPRSSAARAATRSRRGPRGAPEPPISGSARFGARPPKPVCRSRSGSAAWPPCARPSTSP